MRLVVYIVLAHRIGPAQNSCSLNVNKFIPDCPMQPIWPASWAVHYPPGASFSNILEPIKIFITEIYEFTLAVNYPSQCQEIHNETGGYCR